MLIVAEPVTTIEAESDHLKASVRRKKRRPYNPS